MVAVVGPSGIGKSSVVKAGLVPALRNGALPGSDRWVISDMFPGRYPFEELAAAILRVAVERPDDLVEDLARDELGMRRVAKRILPQGTDLLLAVGSTLYVAGSFTTIAGQARQHLASFYIRLSCLYCPLCRQECQVSVHRTDRHIQPG